MAKLKQIFITGGAGWLRLVPFFLKNNYEVCVYDTMYLIRSFRQTSKSEDNWEIYEIQKNCKLLNGYDIFASSMHTNDSSFELNEDLSKTINYDCFEPMVIEAKKSKIKDLFMHPVVGYGVSKERC